MPRKVNTQKRDNLVRASLLALSKKEFDDITVKEVCDLAGIGKNIFYETFKSKQNWYNQIRTLRSRQCWDDLISHYSKMQDTEFSEKMKHLSAYLLVYTRKCQGFRKITKGRMMWRGKAMDLIHSETEEQRRFITEMNAYAVKMKMDPEEVRRNVRLLLSSAVRYGYEALEQSNTIPFAAVKKNLTGISDQLFPEG